MQSSPFQSGLALGSEFRYLFRDGKIASCELILQSNWGETEKKSSRSECILALGSIQSGADIIYARAYLIVTMASLVRLKTNTNEHHRIIVSL